MYWSTLRTSGSFSDGFFSTHNFGRFAGAMEGYGGIFLITWAFVLAGMFPVVFYVAPALADAWHHRKHESLQTLALCAFCAVVLLFSIASTRL